MTAYEDAEIHTSEASIEATNANGETERFPVGAPSEPKTRLGPMVSATQRDRVRAYIRQGLEEGADGGGGQPLADRADH